MMLKTKADCTVTMNNCDFLSIINHLLPKSFIRYFFGQDDSASFDEGKILSKQTSDAFMPTHMQIRMSFYCMPSLTSSRPPGLIFFLHDLQYIFCKNETCNYCARQTDQTLKKYTETGAWGQFQFRALYRPGQPNADSTKNVLLLKNPQF